MVWAPQYIDDVQNPTIVKDMGREDDPYQNLDLQKVDVFSFTHSFLWTLEPKYAIVNEQNDIKMIIWGETRKKLQQKIIMKIYNPINYDNKVLNILLVGIDIHWPGRGFEKTDSLIDQTEGRDETIQI